MQAKIKPGFTSSDLALAQTMAEALWAVATSENNAIARYDSPTYRHAEQAFIASVQTVYGITRDRARRVRDLLCEYGPDDSLTGTIGRGVSSYVQFTLHNPR